MNTNRSQDGFVVRKKPSRKRAIIFAAVMAAVLPAAAQTTTTNATGFAAFQIISERNIFNQNRVPHERVAQAPRVPDSFSLVGTLFYSGGDIAFFDGTSDAWRKALQVGGDIAGFKVTAMTLNSVTLLDGTNQTVLKINTQMRRDDNGHWSVSTEPVSYANAGGAAGISTPPDVEHSPSASPAAGAASDALARLMQRRARQEQQLGQGQ